MSILDGLTKEYIGENSSLLGDFKHVKYNFDIPLYFDISNSEMINFGLAWDICVAGWIETYPAVRGVNIYHPVHEGKTMMRLNETSSNFENQVFTKYAPFAPIEYITYVHENEGGKDFSSGSKSASTETVSDVINKEIENASFGFNNEIVSSHEHSGGLNNARILLGPQRLLDMSWKMPIPAYKKRLVKDKDVYDIGYHFSSTDSSKQMSSRYEEIMFTGKNTFNFMNWHNKFIDAPKLTKVIRRMAQCKEFHGTLGGLSFLALAMNIPTTIHYNNRMVWTPQKQVFKVLAKRSGAKFVEATH
tara:strand:- start:126 stop:1034 length:909 start_codon:yes stop_codon:yes gene_type:complete